MASLALSTSSPFPILTLTWSSQAVSFVISGHTPALTFLTTSSINITSKARTSYKLKTDCSTLRVQLKLPIGRQTTNIELTKLSSCFNNVERDSTQDSRERSLGSILPQSRETTDMEECRVSLWTWEPCSRMKVNTQFRPPDSNTAPDSRVQMNSKTYKRYIHHNGSQQAPICRWLSARLQ